jgi:alkane 1-monooxygenase
MKYLQHLLMAVIILTFPVSFFIGGPGMWWGVIFISVIMVAGDFLLGEDLSTPEYRYPALLNLSLYLSLPVLLIVLIVFSWVTADYDFLGLGAMVQSLTGYDALSARANNTALDMLGAAMSTGYAVGGYGINIAHELTHRTWDRFAHIWGRLLLSLSVSVDFAIEHHYGHHLKVGTPEDPATARRGENVYRFIVRSIAGSIKNAWALEKTRLERKRQRVLGLHNQLLTGYGFSFLLVLLFFYTGGWVGAGLFAIQAAVARVLLEIVNYMEHYGLVREADKPVEPRHSWNTNRRISSILLFSLTRHSAHHEKGEIPFWKLNPYPDAPEMPFGYLTTIYICLIPPLWYRVIAPRLQHWDTHHASAGERRLLEQMAR